MWWRSACNVHIIPQQRVGSGDKTDGRCMEGPNNLQEKAKKKKMIYEVCIVYLLFYEDDIIFI